MVKYNILQQIKRNVILKYNLLSFIEKLKLRLRLVRVKVFSENRYFSKMLFSGKENVFMCLVAFQKNFRKIFFDVWLYS